MKDITKRRAVRVEFTRKEAKDFARSLMEDVSWYDTSQRELYEDLYNILKAAE